MLEKPQPLTSNISRAESNALKSLKCNRNPRSLPADKGNCRVVVNGSTYMEKLNTLLESGVYEPVLKDPTSEIERKVQKLLSKHKSGISSELKCQLTPYHRKLPHLYRLSKTDEKDNPLRPIVSSIQSPCCALAGSLQKIVNPLAGHRVIWQEF
jgi:hypothetical protein